MQGTLDNTIGTGSITRPEILDRVDREDPASKMTFA